MNFIKSSGAYIKRIDNEMLYATCIKLNIDFKPGEAFIVKTDGTVIKGEELYKIENYIPKQKLVI